VGKRGEERIACHLCGSLKEKLARVGSEVRITADVICTPCRGLTDHLERRGSSKSDAGGGGLLMLRPCITGSRRWEERKCRAILRSIKK